MKLTITQFEAREGESNRANGSGRSGGYAYGPFSKTRVYVWLEEQTVLENFLARGDEPHHVYREQIVHQVMERLGQAGVKVVWSRKAGCGCGCSPAFIVQAPNPKGIDVYVTAGRDDLIETAR